MDDKDKPTAWEDINPPARRESSLPAAPSSRAALAVRHNDICDLEPVDRAEFFAEVAPCLTLAAGVGMSRDDQDAWLEAAFKALAGIPIGLLARGAKAAMQSADHPSKIIPAITAAIGDSWEWRKNYRPRPQELAPTVPPERRIERAMTPDQIEEWNAIMARAGASTRYRPDGSRYEAETATHRSEARRPLRKPTRQDYLDMGVDPATLDAMSADIAA